MNGHTNQEERTSSRGLTDAEVTRSRAEHGANTLPRKKGKSFLRRFLSNLNDPVIRILLCALAINLLLLFRDADPIETVGIGIAVFLATLISTLSEHSSAKAFARLSESEEGFCRVRRNGTIRKIPLSELVIGDIVLLCAGDRIPGDGLLIRGSLASDQSSMTGESREAEKILSENPSRDPDAPSSLLRGCTVVRGEGEMCVTEVGEHTFLGRISREIQEEVRESPLRLRLAKLAGQISILGYVAAALVALVYLFNIFVLDSGWRLSVIGLKLSDIPFLLSHLLHAFTLGLTVIVVAVPEGLPMMIAVVLSSNIRRMVKDQVLVQKPVGIEAAGSMNLLFTDKTGTLTSGKMQALSLIDGIGALHPLKPLLGSLSERSLLPLALRYTSDAEVGTNEQGARAVIGGTPTGRALLEAVRALPIPDGVHILDRLPFDSARKYAAVTLLYKGERLTLLLGAPERLLPHVNAALSPADGRPMPLHARRIEASMQERTASGERVLALAIASEGGSAKGYEGGIRTGLSLVGLISLFDPLRPEAAKAVAELRDAGVGVVMITGDSLETARAIGRSCGILSGERDLILTSPELARLSDHRVRELLPRLSILARALPTDKSRLVRIAQEMGLVVGMTGDGINDAPALRRADIGFSMGSGTQVAKDAGDILILDDNLASIVRAVLYGRTIFKSIRKFITLQLTMNFCAVGVTVLCPLLGIDSPVTVIQMLWINMIMDTLGGLAFAGEAPLPDCMREAPKRREEPILNRYMINEILLLGGFTVGLCLAFLKNPYVRVSFRVHPDGLPLLTGFFALFIFSSVLNCFNARTDRLKLTAGLSKNRIFLTIMVAIAVIQILFVGVGGRLLRTVPLVPREWLLTFSFAAAVLPAELIRKLLWRLRGRKNGY